MLYWAHLKLLVEIKVVQLAACVSHHSWYHYIDANLYETIINIAQDFLGINHANPFSPNGQGGTRIVARKDAASTRYIYFEIGVN